MGTVTEHLQLVIDAADRGARATIRGVGEETEKASIKTRLMEAAQARLGVSAENLGQGLKVAAVAGGALAATGLLAWTAKGIEEFTDLASQVRDFQRASGASAEDSSRWVAAADDMEVSADAASKAAFRLNREIGEGGGKLREYGIEIERNKDGTTDLSGTLLNVADAYTHTADQGERARLVQDLFGKGGKDLIPILEQGRKGIEDLFEGAKEGHQIFSQEDLRSAREFDLAMDDLKDTIRGLQIEAGKAVLPTLTDQINNTSEAIELADKGAGVLGTSLGDLGHTVLDSVPGIGQLNKVVGDLGDLFGGGGDEADNFEDKQKKVAEATKNVANAVSEHGKNSKEARDAERELAAASRELKGDQDKVASSLQNVNDKLTTHTQKVYDAMQADLVAAGDKIAYSNAVDGVEGKLNDLNAVLVANMVNNDSSREAVRNAEQAHRDLASAVLNVTSAAAKQAVDNLGPNATAQEKMKAATDAQTTALQGLFAQFPGLREQVQGYIGDLAKVPGTKDTFVNVHINRAELDALVSDLRSITNGVHNVEVGVIGAAASLLGRKP